MAPKTTLPVQTQLEIQHLNAVWRRDAQSPDRPPRCAKRRSCVASRLGVGTLAIGLAMAAFAQDPADFYKQNCFACHTIGGKRMAGPDLAGVSQRQSREWLLRFLQDPKGVIDSGDAYAKKLVEESHGLVMPTIKGLDRARAEALLNLIDAESKLDLSRFGGKKAAGGEPAFTAADIARGKDIVLGAQPLANSGAACISCHNVSGLAQLAGGRLGPDLTHAYDRLGGRRNMTAWLGSPATPTMQAVYSGHQMKADEILALVAYFESASKQAGGAEQKPPVGTFVLIGLGGSIVTLVLMDGFWRKRFRAVRRPLLAMRRDARRHA